MIATWHSRGNCRCTSLHESPSRSSAAGREEVKSRSDWARIGLSRCAIRRHLQIKSQHGDILVQCPVPVRAAPREWIAVGRLNLGDAGAQVPQAASRSGSRKIDRQG